MSRPRLHRLLLGLAVACVPLLPAPAAAQGEDEEFRVGTHVFRRLLHERRVTPLNSWQRIDEDPSHTLVVQLGRPDWPVAGWLTRFLGNGGAVLLATDNQWSTEESVRLTGYRITGDRVRAWVGRPFNPAGLDFEIAQDKVYRGPQAPLPDCLIVEPEETPGLTLFWDSPLRRKKLDVVTNRSSYLERATRFGLAPVPAGLRVLARFPKGCWYDRQPQGYLPQGTTPKAFAVARDVGPGRLLVLADHSVFINEMMIQDDTNNLDFASNAVEWLRDNGRRTRVLFVEDGAIQDTFDIPLQKEVVSLRDLQPWLADAANKIVDQAEDQHHRENHFNTVLISGVSQASGRALFGGVGAENFYLLLVVLASAVLVGYGLRRLAGVNVVSVPVALLAALALGSVGLGNLTGSKTEYAYALVLLASALGLCVAGVGGLAITLLAAKFLLPAVLGHSGGRR